MQTSNEKTKDLIQATRMNEMCQECLQKDGLKPLSVMMNRKKDLQREEDMVVERPDLTECPTGAVLLAPLYGRCHKAKAQNLSTWLTKLLAIVCLTK